jgi:hypothetical protein
MILKVELSICIVNRNDRFLQFSKTSHAINNSTIFLLTLLHQQILKQWSKVWFLIQQIAEGNPKKVIVTVEGIYSMEEKELCELLENFYSSEIRKKFVLWRPAFKFQARPLPMKPKSQQTPNLKCELDMTTLIKIGLQTLTYDQSYINWPANLQRLA